MAQGFFKIPAFLFHNELENIAALVAFAKTFPCTRLLPNDESRRFSIAVKGAKTGVVAARPTQLHTTLGNEVDNVDSGFNFVNVGHEFRLEVSG